MASSYVQRTPYGSNSSPFPGHGVCAAALVWSVVLSLLVALSPAASAAEDVGKVIVRSADVVADGEVTRVTLELSGQPSYRVFAVDAPARLVIDLDDARFQIEDEAATKAAGVVADWRYGPLSDDAARMVLDLTDPALVAAESFVPSNADRSARLTIDLTRSEQEAFANAVRIADPSTGAATTPPDSIVVIDPGHGGIDPGAVGEDGGLEKDLALAFAERLRTHLEAMPGIAVYLTRSDDSFLSLGRRIRIARAYDADLFVSIHADAAPQDYVTGATVYTLSERPSDAEAAALAARENLADEVSGVIEPQVQEEVSGILADLMRRETKSLSFAFASELVETMGEAVRMNSNPKRSARFRVLMAHDIPSVLLELGYLTNAADAEALIRPEWQERAAAAVALAIADFLDPPEDVAHAER